MFSTLRPVAAFAAAAQTMVGESILFAVFSGHLEDNAADTARQILSYFDFCKIVILLHLSHTCHCNRTWVGLLSTGSSRAENCHKPDPYTLPAASLEHCMNREQNLSSEHHGIEMMEVVATATAAISKLQSEQCHIKCCQRTLPVTATALQLQVQSWDLRLRSTTYSSSTCGKQWQCRRNLELQNGSKNAGTSSWYHSC